MRYTAPISLIPSRVVLGGGYGVTVIPFLLPSLITRQGDDADGQMRSPVAGAKTEQELFIYQPAGVRLFDVGGFENSVTVMSNAKTPSVKTRLLRYR